MGDHKERRAFATPVADLLADMGREGGEREPRLTDADLLSWAEHITKANNAMAWTVELTIVARRLLDGGFATAAGQVLVLAKLGLGVSAALQVAEGAGFSHDAARAVIVAPDNHTSSRWGIEKPKSSGAGLRRRR